MKRNLNILMLTLLATPVLAQSPGELFPKVGQTPPSPTRTVAGAAVSGTTKPALTRAPAPDRARLDGAMLDLREANRADYADATTAGRKGLATKLLTQARAKTKDVSPARYAMYLEAARLAALAGDSDLAQSAATEVTTFYEVEPDEVQLKVLDAMAPATTTPEARKTLALAYAGLVQSAVARDDYVSAATCNTRALHVAQAAGDATLATALEARGSDLRELLAEYPKVVGARKILADTPDDPAANGVAGWFVALLKGDFDAGLPLLAKSDKTALKALAARDLALAKPDAKDAPATAALGDAWRDAANTLTGLAKRNALLRAKTQYERFLDLDDAYRTTIKGQKQQIESQLPPPVKLK